MLNRDNDDVITKVVKSNGSSINLIAFLFGSHEFDNVKLVHKLSRMCSIRTTVSSVTKVAKSSGGFKYI